jgi:transposase-like protein
MLLDVSFLTQGGNNRASECSSHPKGRAVMLGRLEAGQHQRDVAQAMGVSLTTFKKWWRRYRAEGPAGLLDRACRPRCSPRQLSGVLRARSHRVSVCLF